MEFGEGEEEALEENIRVRRHGMRRRDIRLRPGDMARI